MVPSFPFIRCRENIMPTSSSGSIKSIKKYEQNFINCINCIKIFLCHHCYHFHHWKKQFSLFLLRPYIFRCSLLKWCAKKSFCICFFQIVSLTELMAGVKAPTKVVQLFQLTCFPLGHKVSIQTQCFAIYKSFELIKLSKKWINVTINVMLIVVTRSI